jgi:hypothetical protein
VTARAPDQELNITCELPVSSDPSGRDRAAGERSETGYDKTIGMIHRCLTDERWLDLYPIDSRSHHNTPASGDALRRSDAGPRQGSAFMMGIFPGALMARQRGEYSPGATDESSLRRRQAGKGHDDGVPAPWSMVALTVGAACMPASSSASPRICRQPENVDGLMPHIEEVIHEEPVRWKGCV